MKQIFMKAFDYLCVVAIPFFATLAVMADPVVKLLFGEQWVESIVLVQILAVAAMAMTPFSITPLMLNATGHAKNIFKIEIVVFSTTALLIFPAAKFGNDMVTALLTLISLIYGSFCYKNLREVLSLTLRDIFLAFVRTLPIVISAIFIPIFAIRMTVFHTDWAVVLFGGIGATLGWIMSVLVSKHPIHIEIRKLATQVRKALKKFFYI